MLKYLAIAAAGAAVAGVGGYAALSGGLGGLSSGSNTQTSTYMPPSGSTTDYAEFMKWLSSVSKPYANQSLAISLEDEFAALAIQQLDLDFLNASSINDQYDLKPYDLHLQDISLMAATKASTYDLFSVDYQDIGSFSNLVLSPTELADKYPDLTYEPIDPSDFLPVPWSYCTSYPPTPFQNSTTSSTNSEGSDDILYIPWDMSTMIQFYRQDLYKQAGLAPATTWTDYVSNVQLLTKSETPFGTVNESSPDISSVFEFMNFLAGYGGSLWTVSNGQIVSGLDTNAAQDALEIYSNLKPYSDPASYTYTWDNVSDDLLHNIASTAVEFSSYEAYMNDPQRSFVVDKMGYALMPAGPSGSYSVYGGSGIGISKYSKNPEIAWLWLQWATALGTQEMTLLGYYQSFPSRVDVFNNSNVQQALQTTNYEAINVTKQTWDAGNIATLLPFPKWLDVITDVDYAISQAWLGDATPSAALSGAIQKIESWGSLTF